MGALSVGDVRTGTIPSLLPSQEHYLKVYRSLKAFHYSEIIFHQSEILFPLFDLYFPPLPVRFVASHMQLFVFACGSGIA
ncbi:MAG: hypothetical protein V1736_10650 [Pseudomonadota bacterium]